MVGAGTFINPLIKIITTVAILAAVYFFFVKPALDTTNEAFERFGLDGLSETFDNLPADIQDQLDSALKGGTQSEATRLGDCVTRAGQNTAKLERCAERFSG